MTFRFSEHMILIEWNRNHSLFTQWSDGASISYKAHLAWKIRHWNQNLLTYKYLKFRRNGIEWRKLFDFFQFDVFFLLFQANEFRTSKEILKLSFRKYMWIVSPRNKIVNKRFGMDPSITKKVSIFKFSQTFGSFETFIWGLFLIDKITNKFNLNLLVHVCSENKGWQIEIHWAAFLIRSYQSTAFLWIFYKCLPYHGFFYD